MLKVLLKKQMTEVLRGLFYNRRTNKARTKKNIVLLCFLFAMLMLIAISGTFTFIAIGLGEGLIRVGMGWLYFALMSGFAILVGTFGSVFNTYSGLYLPKDNSLLLSMPIPVRTIILSRLLNVYLLGTVFSGLVMLPTLIVSWAIAGATVLSVICGLCLLLTVSVIVLILSCLLGWVVAKLSLRLKNKSFVVVLISLLGMGAYYGLYFKAQVWIRELVENAALYGESIKDSAYGLYLFGRIGEGDPIATGSFAAASVLLLVLTVFILSHSFMKIATATDSVGRKSYREKKVRQKSVFATLLMKEFTRFTSSPNYMLNNGLGVVLLPAMGVFLLIKGADVLSSLTVLLQGKEGSVPLLLCASLMMLSTMNDMTAPSVSLEGKSVWIPLSLPIDPKVILKAKLAMQLILTLIPLGFTVACAAIAAQATAAETLMICLLPLIYAVFAAVFGLFAGVKNPIMDWTSELIPLKQSGAVTLALFGGWGFVVVFAAPYFLIGEYIGLVPYLAIWAVIFAAAAVLLYRWVVTKGAEAFSRL